MLTYKKFIITLALAFNLPTAFADQALECPRNLSLQTTLDIEETKEVQAGRSINVKTIGENVPKEFYHWSASHGKVYGVGSKVVYTPFEDYEGQDTIKLRIQSGRTSCPGIVTTVKVLKAGPRLDITETKKEGNIVTIKGKIKNVSDFDNYRITAHSHVDIFYKHRNHPFRPKRRDGSFKIAFRVKALTDRVSLMLIDKTLDPDSEENCSLRGERGMCPGWHDLVRFGKNRVPLKLDDVKVFDAYTYYVRENAGHPDPQINFILNNFTNWDVIPDYGQPVVEGARMIRSHMEHGQSYLYDFSLAIMALSHANKKEEAKQLMKALQGIQVNEGTKRDGSWYFSFRHDGTSIYPKQIGDRRVAGSIAWAVMAINAYKLKFNDTSFDEMNEKAIEYLLSEVEEFEYQGKKYSALKFNQEDLEFTPWPENRIVSIEHNIDLYSALVNYRGPKQEVYHQKAEVIKEYIEAMWNKDHFYPGVQLMSKPVIPNLSEQYLDTQSWAALALSDQPTSVVDWEKALNFNCQTFFESAGYIQGRVDKYFLGFFERIEKNAAGVYAPIHNFVWTEGTLGMIMAMQKLEKELNKPVNCVIRGETYTALDFLKNLETIQSADGGIRYATFTKNTDMGYQGGSLVGAAWLYFAHVGFNPFQPKF